MSRIITIDGPSGAGKSTISRLLAEKLKFLYLDTGAMYRAVAFSAKRNGVGLDDGPGLGALCRSIDLHFENRADGARLFLNHEDISSAIRSPEMDLAASRVSAVREVRQSMTMLQRKMAEQLNIIAEGRDMGTVVFPNADHKFFLTAGIEARAERRFEERSARGESVTRASVRSDMEKRDHQDEHRALAPSKPAADSVVIDTTELSIKEVLEKIHHEIEAKSAMIN